jgi:hypothetical protein
VTVFWKSLLLMNLVVRFASRTASLVPKSMEASFLAETSFEVLFCFLADKVQQDFKSTREASLLAETVQEEGSCW